MKEIKILTEKELSLLVKEELNSHLDAMAEHMEAKGVDRDIIEQFFYTSIAIGVVAVKEMNDNEN